MIKLVPIDAVHASEYNPRRNDEKRLDLTQLSLSKLGFLIPIYADKSGEILSGHQRHLVASRMGFKHIPVQYIDEQEVTKRKAVNILFNRATNDLAKTDSCKSIKKKLYSMDISGISEALPPIEPDTRESFPCVYGIRSIDTLVLARKNHRGFDVHIAKISKALEKKISVPMPIVIDEDLNVINGIGRLQVAVEDHRKIVQCVIVKREQAKFAKAMLNLLSMDFDIGSDYADMLRYNSYMRERATRETDAQGRCALGDGFFKGLFPKNKGRDFFELSGKVLEQWVKKYGTHIVDFGAGKLNNTRTLRAAGLTVSAFEPYFVTKGDAIHKGKSLEIANRFLDEVESGMKYDTVFISSVYNSVPFIEDRKKIAVIAAALCCPGGQVVCWCQSQDAAQFHQNDVKILSSEKIMSFELDYEPNVILSELSRDPKVQKGHTRDELLSIFKPVFGRVKRAEKISRFWYLEADKPTVNPAMLAQALDFEFELPYPDGTTMGLSSRAREVFSKRLGIILPKNTKGGES